MKASSVTLSLLPFAGVAVLLVGCPNEEVVNANRLFARDQPEPVARGSCASGTIGLLGWSVITADLDADGLDEMIAGAPASSGTPGEPGGPGGGVVCIFSTGITGLNLDLQEQFDQTCCGDVSEPGDRFGFALAAGDFNGDGFIDLAIGAPGEDNPGFAGVDHGNVYIRPNSATGFQPGFDLVAFEVVAPTSGNEFGRSLASANFDGDTTDDLAIGLPDRTFTLPTGKGPITGAGSVLVFGGFPGPLVDANSLIPPDAFAGFIQEDLGEVSEAWDRFGRALAAGDFNGDGFADLVIGTPFEDLETKTFFNRNRDNTGLVFWVTGCAQPDVFCNGGGFTQDPLSDIGDDDLFGSSFAVGDFNGDGLDDLAVGTPRENHSGRSDAGAVIVRIGSDVDPLEPLVPLQLIIASDVPGGHNEGSDWFGASLAAGLFEGPAVPFASLAISSPRDDFELVDGPSSSSGDGGLVFVLYGEPTTLGAATGTCAAGYFFDQVPAGAAEVLDHLGNTAMATGDYNGDGFSDLFVGTPRENFGAVDNGVVFAAITPGTAIGGEWHGHYEGTITSFEPGPVGTGDFRDSAPLNLEVRQTGATLQIIAWTPDDFETDIGLADSGCGLPFGAGDNANDLGPDSGVCEGLPIIPDQVAAVPTITATLNFGGGLTVPITMTLLNPPAQPEPACAPGGPPAAPAPVIMFTSLSDDPVCVNLTATVVETSCGPACANCDPPARALSPACAAELTVEWSGGDVPASWGPPATWPGGPANPTPYGPPGPDECL